MTTSPFLEKLPEILLMGPGPSCIPGPVYAALSRPTIGHMDPDFIAIMDECKKNLQSLLHTGNRLTVPVSGTGSAGMEACVANLVEPGAAVLVCVNGVFGARLADCAARQGAAVDTLDFRWGTPVDVAQVKEQCEKKTYDLVAVVHAETSTGVCNPVQEIGAAIDRDRSLFLVDAVTSFGGMAVNVDEWGIDALYSGTQKCLSCPPGLAPLTFSERALERLMNRTAPVPSWYLDLRMIVSYWEGARRVYHHTAPVNMIYALHQALREIIDEGEAQVYARHVAAHEQLVEGIERLGLSLLVDKPYRLPMLNAVHLPENADDGAVRSALRNEYCLEIGAGLGPLAGNIWRIGLMGHTARAENVERFLSALASVMKG